MTRRNTIGFWIVLALLIFLGSSGLFFLVGRSPDVEETLGRAKRLLQRGQYTEVEKLTLAVPENHRLFSEAMLLAAEAATRLRHLDDAARRYRMVIEKDLTSSRSAKFGLANVLIHTGELSEAILLFQWLVSVEPDDVASQSRLAFLYAATARRWEGRPHLEAVMRSGSARVDELGMLADLERHVDEGPFLKKCSERYPRDIHVRLGLAMNDAQNGRPDAAISELHTIIAEQPSLTAAHSLLGELLAAKVTSEFERWHEQLSPDADAWPDIWYARGLRARFHNVSEAAAKCFWKALQLSPVHRRANYQLGRVLTELGHEEADVFSEQARLLFELTQAVHKAIQSDGSSEVVLREVVELLDRTGRVWETCAWCQLTRQKFPEATWTAAYLERLAPLLNRELPMVLPDKDPAKKIDLSGFPDFDSLPKQNLREQSAAPDQSFTAISFREEFRAGLDFQYFNAADDTTRGARMQEQTGGGVTVVDIDRDGWPDLYLVQGCRWQSGESTPSPSPDLTDQIFRNRFGVQFENVSPKAGIRETGFGQSCAAGDFNEDGFEDLYVANIGQNSLYLNNGDGTFSRTDPPQESPGNWTSGVAVTDINADGWPDLIEINYVTGELVYSRICSGRACSPSSFNGTPDRLHLSDGSGQFRTLTSAADEKDSKGLGLIVFRNPDQLRPSVFIANDQTPKFLMALQTDTDGSDLWSDSAFRTGLAYNGDGLLTAAMGIAADDLNDDGLLDFFVTNFRDEANTLYVQQSEDIFHDTSRAMGVDMAGVPYVGWGTQFLDADRDGAPDLVIANGHVDDYRDEGGEFQMRPQLLVNTGDRRFREFLTADPDSYFAKRFHGRGLARIDWNGDGLMDFVTSNINAPVSLVTNMTERAGHYLNVRLRGGPGNRDALFSRVEIETESGRKRTRQLCTGDGFHAGNEKLIQIGIGNEDRIRSLRVIWNSGSVTRVSDPPINCTLEVYEAVPVATVIRDQVHSTFPVSDFFKAVR